MLDLKEKPACPFFSYLKTAGYNRAERGEIGDTDYEYMADQTRTDESE